MDPAEMMSVVDVILEQVVGPLLTALVMLGVDRVLDKRLVGPRPKLVVGHVPFWWILAWALPVGGISAIVVGWGEMSTLHLVAAGTVTLVLVALAGWATRRRFGW